MKLYASDASTLREIPSLIALRLQCIYLLQLEESRPCYYYLGLLIMHKSLALSTRQTVHSLLLVTWMTWKSRDRFSKRRTGHPTKQRRSVGKVQVWFPGHKILFGGGRISSQKASNANLINIEVGWHRVARKRVGSIGCCERLLPGTGLGEGNT